MGGGRKARHVDADLGDDDGGRDIADAGNGGQAQGGVAKGFEPVIHLPIDLANYGIDGIGLGEMGARQQALVRGHASSHRLDVLRAGGPDPGMDVVGQALRVALAPGQRVADGSPALAHADVGEDREPA